MEDVSKPTRKFPEALSAIEKPEAGRAATERTEPSEFASARLFGQPLVPMSQPYEAHPSELADPRQFDRGVVTPEEAAGQRFHHFDYGLLPSPNSNIDSLLLDDTRVPLPSSWRTPDAGSSDTRDSLHLGSKANSPNRFQYEKAIPFPVRHEGSYRNIAVNLDDSRNREPLVKLTDFGIAGEEYYAHHKMGESTGGLEAREGVAERLAKVNAKLAPLGLELYVLDAYRPIETQNTLFKHFLRDAQAKLGPHASNQAVLNEALKVVSDPRNFDAKDPHTWPPHITGGAVDLTLRRLSDGKPVNMGGAFDENSPRSNTAYYEQPGHQNNMQAKEARHNRRILFNAMSVAGFASNPHEWWHFDYGTQMGIRSLRAIGRKAPNQAFYGAIDNYRDQ